MPVTKTSKKDIIGLDWVFCIYYSIWFKKNKTNNKALINSDNEINAMTSGYISKLGLKVCLTNVEVQKIDDSIFEMFEIVLVSF